MSHPVAVVSVAIVAAISLALTLLGVAAYRRNANRKLLFVTAAFSVFFVKSALTSWALATDAIHHETLEIVGGAGDLLVVGLLIAPFLQRRHAP